MARSRVQAPARKIRSGKQLLQALTDNPDLPAFVPTLPATGLKALVDEVGRHDAGPLIEYATPAQLVTLIDESIWKPSTPGAPDSFDPLEFLEWADVLLEVGDDFTVQRLRALDEGLLVLAIARLVTITDLEKQVIVAARSGVSQGYIPDEMTVDAKDLFGPFEVTARHEDEWDTVQRLLTALHLIDPDYLQALLTRCCTPESIVAFRDDGAATLDAEADHQARREAQGFVNPESAGGFLRTAREADLDTLLAATGYDIDTADYFRRARRAALDAVMGGGTGAALQLGSDSEDFDDAEARPAPDPARMGELEALVAQVELDALATSTHGPDRQIAGPASARPTMNAVQAALQRLATESPDCLPQRMHEAAYLANLLMAGSRLDGRLLTRQEAAEAVMAICNLGLESAPDTVLEHEPGLVAPFRLGWHLIQQLPMQVIECLRQALADDRVLAQLGARAWMASEVAGALGDESIATDIADGRLAGVRESLQMLALVTGDDVVARVLALVDHLPTITGRPDGIRMTEARRFIETPADLGEIRRFLAELPSRLHR